MVHNRPDSDTTLKFNRCPMLYCENGPFRSEQYIFVYALLRLPLPGGRLCLFVNHAWPPPLIHLVTLISAKPLFQFIWCSTDLIQVLFPKLHPFFKKFGKIFVSWRPSLIFFVKLGPCHPDIYKTGFSIHFVFNILDASINSWAASIFQKVREDIRDMAAIFILISSN